MSRRKARPEHGEPIVPGMSERDIAAALGVSRRWIWQIKQVAEIPKPEFERLIERGHETGTMPTLSQLVDVARRRATPRRRRMPKVCPHCGGGL